jgi:hypothetical protein
VSLQQAEIGSDGEERAFSHISCTVGSGSIAASIACCLFACTISFPRFIEPTFSLDQVIYPKFLSFMMAYLR